MSPTRKPICATTSKRKGSSSSRCSRSTPSAGVSLQLPQRQGINTREFLVFNQELATLLKAGMPLVQSLGLLKSRVTSPTFRSVLNDVHEKVRSGTALSDAFAAHGDLFPRVYGASLLAGERSGNLDAVLRRYVEYTKIIATVKRKTDLGAGLPGDPGVAGRRAGLDHRA